MSKKVYFLVLKVDAIAIFAFYIFSRDPPEEKTIPYALESLQAQVGGLIEAVYPWLDHSVRLVCNV